MNYENIINIRIIKFFYVFYEKILSEAAFMKHNPFRKRTEILPSYFTGRENELIELK